MIRNLLADVIHAFIVWFVLVPLVLAVMALQFIDPETDDAI